MPDVIVGALLGLPRLHRQRLLGPIQRLNLGLLIDAEHDRVLGRVQIRPDNVGDLGDQLGIGRELERFGPPRLHPVMPPGPQHRRGIHPQMIGQQPRRPMRHTEPGRRRCQRSGQDFGPVYGPWPSRAPLILQPSYSRAHIPVPPADHRRTRHPDLSGDLSVGDSIGGEQHDPGPLRQTALIELDRVQDSNKSRSPGRRPNGCAHPSFSRIPLSNYFRRAALADR